MFELTREKQALKARARELAREVIAPRAAEVDRSEQYPWDNVAALKEAGFMGLTVPKAWGTGTILVPTYLILDPWRS